MIISEKWKDYELIDMGGGEKLERWGKYTFVRPDPQIIWDTDKGSDIWNDVHAHYHRSSNGGGSWEYKSKLPPRWQIDYDDLKFIIQPTDFKHLGLFPEQAVNWEWLANKIAQRRAIGGEIKILSLFGYTGGATVACAKAGAHVCHLDAAKAMLQWAKENAELSGVDSKRLRFIADDAVKFVQREIRRNNKYDGIIMDPPSYGRGPGGELWKLEEKLFGLVELCSHIMSNTPLFFLLNSYTTGFSPTVAENILKLTLLRRYGGTTESGELGIKATTNDLILPCGVYGRWENNGIN